MRKRIARQITNIFNPFLVGLALILLVSFEASASVFGAIKWSLILIALSILPVFIFTVFLVRHDRLDSMLANVRKQRTTIYITAVIMGGISCITLFFLRAPLLLMALCVAGFSTSAIFMCVNLRWKISIHTAIITATVTVLFILYGYISASFLALIPLVAWARIELEHHSLAQVVIASLLAASILIVVMYAFLE